MMTIHELANYSGISVRTLHYYDKINLLKPCAIEQNGYRKYNEDSVRRLQQIMFYKEMDLPLKQIKDIMNQPMFDQKSAISHQRDFLIAKKNRLTKLIKQMEQILEGNNTMDFKVFEHNELEEVIKNRILQLDAEYQQPLIEKDGSIDAYVRRMMKNEDKIRASAVERYGSVEQYIEFLKKAPLPKEGSGKLQLKLDNIAKELAGHKGEPVSNPEIQKLVGEWEETVKTITERDDISALLPNIYHSLMNNQEIIKLMDEIRGDGSSVFIGRAMEYHDINRIG